MSLVVAAELNLLPRVRGQKLMASAAAGCDGGDDGEDRDGTTDTEVVVVVTSHCLFHAKNGVELTQGPRDTRTKCTKM